MGIEFLRHPSFRYPFSLGLLFLGAVFGLSCDSDLTGPSKNDPVQEWSFDYEPPAFFYDIWGSGPGDIFLASGSGNVAHLDGTLLTEMGPRGEFGRIRGIWGTSSNDVVQCLGTERLSASMAPSGPWKRPDFPADCTMYGSIPPARPSPPTASP